MRRDDSHISDRDLLLATDERDGKVQAHLDCCAACRARLREMEGAMTDFALARRDSAAHLPPLDEARARLRIRMAEIAATPVTLWQRLGAAVIERRALALVCSAALSILIGMFALGHREIRSIPDPRLTPGATLPISRADVCDGVERPRVVPAVVARQVFAAYGIQTPQPRAYEVDYLITPALGGSDSIRNFWPQPYGDTAWNAHIKDALEDHLRRLVCEGQLDLATAQHDIARDWVAAYKKYFHTDKPLREHSSFLKDQPWE